MFSGLYTNENCLEASNSTLYSDFADAILHVTNEQVCIDCTSSLLDLSIKADITDNSITNPVVLTGNFLVLAMFSINNTFRVVLQESSADTIYYIEYNFEDNPLLQFEGYNSNWYKLFVKPHTMIIEEKPQQMRDTTYTQVYLYYSATTIYGELIEEYIRVANGIVYPTSKGSEQNADFYFTLGIRDKFTDYTPAGGTRVRTNDCSLNINNGRISLASSYGDYFAELHTSFTGSVISNSAPITLSFNATIPSGLFNIALSYSINQPTYNPPNNETHYEYMGNPGIVQITNYWDGGKYSLTTAGAGNGAVGNHYWAHAVVITDSNHMTIGNRPMKYKWNFTVFSTCVNPVYNCSVDVHTEHIAKENQVTYSLFQQ